MGVHVRACRDEWWIHDPTDSLLRRGSTHARPPTTAAGGAAVRCGPVTRSGNWWVDPKEAFAS